VSPPAPCCKYVEFCDWLLFLTLKFSEFTHDGTCISTSSSDLFFVSFLRQALAGLELPTLLPQPL
jgi:hypothetical protein